MGTIYTCIVKSSQYLSNETHITGFTGTHLSGYSNANVKGFYFQGNCYHIKAVPTNVHEYFPNFIALCLSGCGSGIKTFDGNELNQYRNLEAFALYHTDLERIPGDFFSFNPRIFSVYFGNNKIKHVGANLFDHIQGGLRDVYFRYNTCIDQAATTPGAISTLIYNLRVYCPDTEVLNGENANLSN
jgi:hypothetical protein